MVKKSCLKKSRGTNCQGFCRHLWGCSEKFYGEFWPGGKKLQNIAITPKYYEYLQGNKKYLVNYLFIWHLSPDSIMITCEKKQIFYCKKLISIRSLFASIHFGTHQIVHTDMNTIITHCLQTLICQVTNEIEGKEKKLNGQKILLDMTADKGESQPGNLLSMLKKTFSSLR